MRRIGKEMGCEVRGAGCEKRYWTRWVAGLGQMTLALALVALWILNGWSDEPQKVGEHHHHPTTAPPQQQVQPRSPVKQPTTLATPKGWRFTIPAGDHHAGRQAFIDFECFKCHEVLGEDFPAPKAEQGDVGPALSGMGVMHPAEYFTETIIDPNASVAWRIRHHKSEQKGYLGPDGTSKMPDYNDTMTIQQLIDLVAYMKSLTVGGHRH